MEFSSIVPSHNLQDELGMGTLNFEVALSALSNSKVRNESRTKNGQIKEGSQLESMLPSIASLLQKKFGSKSRPVNEGTVRGFCVVQSRARESQKRKTSHCTKSKCFTERVPAFFGEFRSNGPKVFIGSPN